MKIYVVGGPRANDCYFEAFYISTDVAQAEAAKANGVGNCVIMELSLAH